MNPFQRSKEYPFHISIGAVVVDQNKKVACHYFKSLEIPDFGMFENFYILMRETIEPNESIEQCLARGLQEEFGCVAKARHYIGSVVSKFPLAKEGPIVEKTTLYFLCDLINIDKSARRPNDPESGSEVIWLEPAELIRKMKDQRLRLGREDADESVLLENILQYLK